MPGSLRYNNQLVKILLLLSPVRIRTLYVQYYSLSMVPLSLGLHGVPAQAVAFGEDFMELVEIFCGFLDKRRFSRPVK